MNGETPLFTPYTEQACAIERSRPDAESLCADERTSEGLDYAKRGSDPNRPLGLSVDWLPVVPFGLITYGPVDVVSPNV
jgi:hypothetical protein